ncbi:unnamed protein product [Rotaria sp. Silwood1]|nr:unnamed protein product [Rotaria sp. Silwood1]CAF4769684.1 unnamed protein product [Rotaria sp. Silwood1]
MNKKRQSTIVIGKCEICNGPAQYIYFGVLSCQPCRMFFKRNALRGKELSKCDFDGHCEINVNNRHVCSYCRLEKCFTKGMQTEKFHSFWPRTSITSQKRKHIEVPAETISTALVPLNQSEQFPTLNLLRSDQSTLTIDQWNLLSNIVNCYEAYNGFLIGESYMHEQHKLPLKLRFKPESVSKLYEMTLEQVQQLYKNNQDFLSLPSHDRSILLHSTFGHTSTLSLNVIAHPVGLFNYSTYYDVLGTMSHPRVIPIAKRIASRLDFDIVIMRLFLAILSFSTINYTVYSDTPPVDSSNTKQILHIQDTYVELTWRYILYKFNYEQAVETFSDFIRCLFGIHDDIVTGHEVQWFSNTIDSLVQKTEETILHDD